MKSRQFLAVGDMDKLGACEECGDVAFWIGVERTAEGYEFVAFCGEHKPGTEEMSQYATAGVQNPIVSDNSDSCDGCGGDPTFAAAVDGGTVELCEGCREVVASIIDAPEESDVPERESYAVVAYDNVPLFVFEDRDAGYEFVEESERMGPEYANVWWPIRRHDI